MLTNWVLVFNSIKNHLNQTQIKGSFSSSRCKMKINYRNKLAIAILLVLEISSSYEAFVPTTTLKLPHNCKRGTVKDDPRTINRSLCVRGGGGVPSIGLGNIDMHPFIGLGFRHKEDDISGKVTTTGHVGALRKSSYYCVPVGLSMHYDLQEGWGVHVSGEYDIFSRRKTNN